MLYLFPLFVTFFFSIRLATSTSSTSSTPSTSSSPFPIRSYTQINYVEVDTFAELQQKYFNRANHSANTNILLGVATQECQHYLNDPSFRGIQRYAGGNVILSVKLPAEQYPLKLSEGCAALFYYPVNTNINEPSRSTYNFDHKFLCSWTSDIIPVRVTFTNRFNFPVALYWEEESQAPVFQGELAAGEELPMRTRLGHVFIVRDSREGGNVIDYLVVDGQDYAFHPSNRLESCDVDELQRSNLVERELSCQDLEARKEFFVLNVWHDKRIGLNYVQPQLVRPVTKEGFKLRKLPADTYAWLKAWYEDEKARQGYDEKHVGPCMNQIYAPSSMVHVSGIEKDRLSRDLKPILQEWYGGEEIDLTSIYGIRKYTNGSILRMHVDTVGTHVVSAIINVDQKVEKDWPLVILDHNHNEVEVIMQPGDMLLYESAKLLHGRPSALIGERYENIFIHYKPRHGWDYAWI